MKMMLTWSSWLEVFRASQGNPLLVRIVDFGLAKFTEERTSSSKAMGTPAYMAPEHLLQGEMGPWSDLYSVGAVAFELLTGRRPFPGRTSQEIVVKKVDPQYDPLSRIADVALPGLTRAFLKRALAREPSTEVPEGPVLRQWRTGYRLGDRVLRPAAVVVSAGPPSAPPAEAAAKN